MSTSLLPAKGRALWKVLALPLLLGCEPESSTQGDAGRVEFSYGEGCVFGCSLTDALLVGSTERIDVSEEGDASGVTVESSVEEVARFRVDRHCTCSRQGSNWVETRSVGVEAACQDDWQKSCDNTIHVHAVAEGDTELILRDSAGQVLDQTTVSVRLAGSLRFSSLGEDEPLSELDISVAATHNVQVDVFAADGRRLLARDGVHWSSTTPAVAGFADFAGASDQPAHTRSRVALVGLTQGQAQLQVSVAGAAGRLPLRVR